MRPLSLLVGLCMMGFSFVQFARWNSSYYYYYYYYYHCYSQPLLWLGSRFLEHCTAPLHPTPLNSTTPPPTHTSHHTYHTTTSHTSHTTHISHHTHNKSHHTSHLLLPHCTHTHTHTHTHNTQHLTHISLRHPS